VVLAAGELADGARDLCVAERAGAAARAARVTGSDDQRQQTGTLSLSRGLAEVSRWFDAR
jgi:hypothetical protein